MKKVYPALIFVLLLNWGYSQTWMWAKDPLTPWSCDGNAITADEEFIYVAYEAPELCSNYDNVNICQGPTCIIAKHTKSGKTIWTKRVQGKVQSMTVDSHRNLISTGFYNKYTGPLCSADPSFTFAPHENMQAFVIKMDNDGSLIWSKEVNTLKDNEGVSVKTDGGLNVYVLYHTFFYDGNATSLVKYDSSGSFLWEKTFTGSPIGTDIEVDLYSNCYVAGYFYDSIQIQNTVLKGGTYTNMFVAKFKKSGDLSWARKLGSNYGEAHALKLDKFGYLYVTGCSVGPSFFDNESLPYKGMFVTRMDTNGKVLWARGSTARWGLSLATFEEYCVVAGEFDIQAILGNENITLNTTKISRDIFLAKYDSSGSLHWAVNPTGPSGGLNQLRSMCYSNPDFFITGNFTETTQFGESTLSFPHTPQFTAYLACLRDNTAITSLQQNQSINFNWTIFPNPTNNLITVSLNDLEFSTLEIDVMTVAGSLLITRKLEGKGNRENITIDLEKYPHGVYLVTLRVNGTKSVKKVIRN